MIRAITFDFWGTLFRDADSDLRQKLRVHAVEQVSGASEDRINRALKAMTDEFARCHIEEQRTLTPRDAALITTRLLGVELADEVIDALAYSFATAILRYPAVPIDGALEAVRAAAARVPIGLISDTGISPGSSLRALMDRHGFTSYFNALTFSDEVGVAKPQRPVFEHTAEALGVAPAEMLHIGDLEPTDIAGIRAVGGKGALFTGVNARFREMTKAEYTFATWPEFTRALPEILGQG